MVLKNEGPILAFFHLLATYFIVKLKNVVLKPPHMVCFNGSLIHNTISPKKKGMFCINRPSLTNIYFSITGPV